MTVIPPPQRPLHSVDTVQLRSVREAQGRTLQDVAFHAGLSEPALGAIELGKADPKLSTLRRIAVALGLEDLEQLLAGLVPERETTGEVAS